MAFAPDGRLFVCQQAGRVRVVKNGVLLPANFATVTTHYIGERGLLGLAFDPDFATNGFLYVYYTVPANGSVPAHNRVSRFQASAANPDVSTGSETILFELDPLGDSYNHNGGALHFGNDGKLYVAVGDNVVSANAQQRNSLFGKILRINKDGSIPTDNPTFSEAPSQARYGSVWAIGLRNPFTFAFQRSNGRLFINDVGAGSWEEINDGVAGSNYGWPTTEGPTGDARFRAPLYAYGHGSNADQGFAITGGVFYEATQFPTQYRGQYFYQDYVSGWIRVLNPANNATTQFAAPRSDISAVDLDTGPDGSLYYLSLGKGGVYKITYTAAPTFVAQPQNQTVSNGQPATFSAEVSGNGPFNFQWQRNGANIAGATASTYTLPTTTLSDSGARFRVIVTNNFSAAISNDATLTVLDSRAPVPVIATPLQSTLYRAGETFSFSGSATDPEDGTLPASAFTWRIDFHHDTHTHPFMPPTGGLTSGQFTIPSQGETSTNVWYRITLTVRDSSGLSSSVTRDLRPRIGSFRIETYPPRLQTTLDGEPIPGGYDVPGVVGLRQIIGATSPQVVNGETYTFARWSDGGAQTHEVAAADAPRTFTAYFSDGVAPTIALQSPAENFSYRSLSGASGTAADAHVGLEAVTAQLQRLSDNLFWNGSTWTAASAEFPASGTNNWSVTFPALADGQYTFRATARDFGGLKTATPTVRFYIDNAGPIPTVFSPTANSAYRSIAEASGTARDAGGGVALVTGRLQRLSDNLFWNGSAWTSAETEVVTAGTDNWTLAFPSLLDGRYRLRVTATDFIDNMASSPEVEFAVDNAAPSNLTIATPQNGVLFRSFPHIAGTAGDADTMVQRVLVSLRRNSDGFFWNGSVWTSANADLTTTLNGSNWTLAQSLPSDATLLSGAYTISATALDAANNTQSTSITISIDRNVPTVAISSPTSLSNTRSTPRATGSANDAAGIANVTILLYRYSNAAGAAAFWARGSVWTAAYNANLNEIPTNLTAGTNGAVNWSQGLPELPTGRYWLRASVTDRAGNLSRSSVVTFFIDRTAPTIAISQPKNGAIYPVFTRAAGGARDAGSGLQRVTMWLYRYAGPNGAAGYWMGGSNWSRTFSPAAERPAAGTLNWALKLPSLPPGRYMVRASAYDKAGNFNRSTSNVFTVTGSTRATPTATREASPLVATPLEVTDEASPVTLSSARYEAASSTISLNWTGAVDIEGASFTIEIGDHVMHLQSTLARGATVVLSRPDQELNAGRPIKVLWRDARDANGRTIRDGSIVIVTP
ncbi:MAG: hypothetical protein JWN98_177 [Abditibacteriota bacterium]|nr:hypothetical protein [Abditibacteriota bacterium]